ncbi:MAG: NHL repeat-containing protein [Rhodothermales bacterium]
MRGLSALLLLVGTLLLGGVQAVHAQDTLSIRLDTTPLATFRDARALALDPMGRRYVVDAGRDAVVVLDTLGRGLRTLGGPGAGAGTFDEPHDVDPTNGLSLVVADAGNGRLQRLSREGAWLGELVLPGERLNAGEVRQGFERETAFDDQGDGQPVGVIVASDRSVFAIDAQHAQLVKWDADGRVERLIGDFGAARGRLSAPVAMAMVNETVWVADADLEAVLVYDAFGTFMRTVGQGIIQDPHAVVNLGRSVGVVMPSHILVFEPTGRLARRILIDAPAPVMDVALTSRHLLVLTRIALYAVPRHRLDPPSSH